MTWMRDFPNHDFDEEDRAARHELRALVLWTVILLLFGSGVFFYWWCIWR
jgi:hypothetical protein